MTRNTVLYYLLFTAVGTVLNVTIAIMIDQLVLKKAAKLMQTLMIIPVFISYAAVQFIVFAFIDSRTGMINNVLGTTTRFYSKANYWPWILLIVKVWKDTGYGSVLYMSVLSGIDTSLYEAADIDGASGIRQFFSITVPLLSPTTFFIVQTRVIGALTVFDLMFMVMDRTNAALQKVQSIVYLFYDYAFNKGNKGYGATLVMVLLIFIMIVTLVMQKAEKKFVFYN